MSLEAAFLVAGTFARDSPTRANGRDRSGRRKIADKFGLRRGWRGDSAFFDAAEMQGNKCTGAYNNPRANREFAG